MEVVAEVFEVEVDQVRLSLPWMEGMRLMALAACFYIYYSCVCCSDTYNSTNIRKMQLILTM